MTRVVVGIGAVCLAAALFIAAPPVGPAEATDGSRGLEPNQRPASGQSAGGRSVGVQASPAALLLSEDFGLAFPPPGWSVTSANASYTWMQGSDTYGPLDGDARVNEDPAHAAQNEWLKTPTLNFSGSISEVRLTFHFKMSYVRSVAPDDLQNLEVWSSTNGGSTFPTKVWDETDVGVFPNYQWVTAHVNLPALVGKNNVKLAFRSVGTGGGPVDIDMVEVATYLCGDVTHDQALTSADVIFLVNYIFKGGPAPDPPSEADMNNNGVVNSADIVYIVNYVFKAGPPPPCP